MRRTLLCALSASALAAVAGLLATSAVHLALTPAHLAEMPVLGVLFALSTAAGALVALAAWAGMRHWEAAADALLAGLVAAYLETRLFRLEGWDGIGLATVAVEVVTLAVLAAGRRRAPRRPLETAPVPWRGGHRPSGRGPLPSR